MLFYLARRGMKRVVLFISCRLCKTVLDVNVVLVLPPTLARFRVSSLRGMGEWYRYAPCNTPVARTLCLCVRRGILRERDPPLYILVIRATNERIPFGEQSSHI